MLHWIVPDGFKGETTMRKIVSSLIILMFLVCVGAGATRGSAAEHATVSASPAKASSPALAPEIKRAMYAIKVFKGRLQGELIKAMQAGGPVNAIEVCNTRAEDIAAEVSKKQNFTMKRVSLKNRNPHNAADGWQRTVLTAFEQRKQNGEPVTGLTYADIVETDTGKQFRFMKAIPAGSICMKCHGTNIAPAVQTELDALYPGDKARGYKPGDIRGAFVVTRDLDR